MTEAQLRSLHAIASAAVATERATNVPAELITAQAILESAWLTRAPGHNAFGIKAAKRHGMTQLLDTHEVIGGKRVAVQAKFAAYQSLEAAFSDHALLIATGRPYSLAWQRFRADGDVDALIDGVAHVYATDPAYSHKLKRILAMPAVAAAIQEARGVASRPGLIQFLEVSHA